MPTLPVTTSLAERLRAETRSLHVEAERSPFMAALLRGRMARSPYVALLRNLLPLYAALEAALARHADHPALAPLGLAALARSRSLAADLALLEDGIASAFVPQASTVRYVSRLQQLDADAPELLLAHAYVRYLGDLSGGQILRRIVAASPELAAPNAIAFYDFGAEVSIAERTLDFRAGLDSAVVADADAIVAEARLAFEWHRYLFDELAEAHGIRP